MKRKVIQASLVWLLLITGLHLHVNVGWRQVGDNIQVAFGYKRKTLEVGFLPVT